MRGVTQIALLYVCIVSGCAQRDREWKRFRCRNGEYIASDLLCNGHLDCRDASDETRSECSKSEIRCPDYAFRCNYGACINRDAICNGVRDCVDNSDETLPQCDTRRTRRRCSVGQFACDNGQCINDIGLCDGTRDCADGSDETYARCSSLPCSQFRCAYGACIDSDLRCNGVINCADGSDENPQLCNQGRLNAITTPRQTSVTKSSSEAITCTAPPQPQNGRWMLHSSLCADRGNCVVPEGTKLPSASHLIYSCNEGYILNGSANVICNFEGQWFSIPECTGSIIINIYL